MRAGMRVCMRAGGWDFPCCVSMCACACCLQGWDFPCCAFLSACVMRAWGWDFSQIRCLCLCAIDSRSFPHGLRRSNAPSFLVLVSKERQNADTLPTAESIYTRVGQVTPRSLVRANTS